MVKCFYFGVVRFMCDFVLWISRFIILLVFSCCWCVSRVNMLF